MIKKENTYQLKGFTIAELLVVLVLTSISITLSYTSLTYIQKLFAEYKKQNKFLNEFTDLKKRLDYESLKADLVIEEQDNNFTIRRDSFSSTLQLLDHVILLKRNERCDTFHLSAKNIKKEYELMRHPLWTNKLVNKLQFEIEFTKQKFAFCLYKDHATAIKLKLERGVNTWQE
jgi:prepilin-type N-terminal cleavage/methylation domain-containing protein